jgi:hypothetical protein
MERTMNSIDFLDKKAAEQGWNIDAQHSLLIAFINQQSPVFRTAFEEYLQEVADIENAQA